LANLIASTRRAGTGFAVPPLRRFPWPGLPEIQELPTSYPQERLWFLDRLDPGNPAFNIAFGAEMRGQLDAPALRAPLGAARLRRGDGRPPLPADRTGPALGPAAGRPRGDSGGGVGDRGGPARPRAGSPALRPRPGSPHRGNPAAPCAGAPPAHGRGSPHRR